MEYRLEIPFFQLAFFTSHFQKACVEVNSAHGSLRKATRLAYAAADHKTLFVDRVSVVIHLAIRNRLRFIHNIVPFGNVLHTWPEVIVSFF